MVNWQERNYLKQNDRENTSAAYLRDNTMVWK